MSLWRAFVFLPGQPGESADVLARSRWGWATPMIPALLGVSYLASRGVAWADAGRAGLALFLLALALAVGGTLASIPATMLTGAPLRLGVQARRCAAYGAWALLLFVLLILLMRVFGAQTEALLLAAIVLLAWGTAAGVGIVTDEDHNDTGRGLVGSLVGLSGAIGGLALVVPPIQALLVVIVLAPAAGQTEQGQAPAYLAGDPLLVVRREPVAGEVALMQDVAEGAVRGREAVLGLVRADGTTQPFGDMNAEVFARTRWQQAGCACFRFGGPGGGRPLRP